MANALKHKFTSGKVDTADPLLIQPSNWNAEHVFSGGTDGQLLSYLDSASDNVAWVTRGSVSGVFNVKDSPFLAVGDGVADDYDAIVAAYNAMPTGHAGKLYFPPGIYRYDTALNLVGNNLHIRGDNATLYFTGTGIPFSMNGGVTNYWGSGIENIRIKGNANATKGLFVHNIHHGTFRNIFIEDVADAALELWFTVLNTFENIRVSVNEGTGLSPKPTNGLICGGATSAEACAGNSFINVIIEGVSGDGIWLKERSSLANTFLGGASEGNGGRGVLISGACNTFIGMDCEANGDDDWEIAAGAWGGGNTVNNRLVNVIGNTTTKKGLDINGGMGAVIEGGLFYTVSVTGGTGASLKNVGYSVNLVGGTWTNSTADSIEENNRNLTTGVVRPNSSGQAQTYTGAVSTGADFYCTMNAKGVILKNAAGSVIKRVRLNDAGDGLIFEAP